jgi:hypothetical protein
VANPHLEADYLFMQGVICQRIEEQTQFNVRGIDSLVQATENDVRDAVVYVLYEGEKVEDRAGNGSNQIIRQRYCMLLGLANATQNDEAARNSAAGPLLSKVHKALAGWAPEQAHGRTLKRTNGRTPIYSTNFGLYPLTFEILLNL